MSDKTEKSGKPAASEHRGVVLPEGMTPALLDHWIVILNQFAANGGDPTTYALRLFNEVPLMGSTLKKGQHASAEKE